MKLSESVMPISEVKAHASQMIHNISVNRKPVIITLNGRAKAIVQDLHSYEQTQESLAMLKIIALGREDVRKGRLMPLHKAFDDVRLQIRSKRAA